MQYPSLPMSCSICCIFCHLKWLKNINKLLLGTTECNAILSYYQIKEKASAWQRKCWICVRFQQNNSKESWKFTLHLNTELFSPVKAGWVQTSLRALKISFFVSVCHQKTFYRLLQVPVVVSWIYIIQQQSILSLNRKKPSSQKEI